MTPTDSAPGSTPRADRTVARVGWFTLLMVGAVTALHGVGQYVLSATTPGERTAGILLAAVGSTAFMAAAEGLRSGSRWAWKITWVMVAALAGVGAHVLLGGMRIIDGRYLAFGAVALAGQILAAADRSPTSPGHLSIGRQLRAAYPIGFAYAAGVFSALAALQLLGFYVVEFGLPQSGGPLGSANDLMGALAGVVMIPVAIALAARLHSGPATVLVPLTGVVGMIGAALAGPLLVYGVVDFFPTQLAIGSTASALIVAWITLTSRALGRSPFWSAPARLGRSLGVGFIAALALLAAGALVPSPSPVQEVVLGIGFLVGGLVWLAVPPWFFLVGGRLGSGDEDVVAAMYQDPAVVL